MQVNKTKFKENICLEYYYMIYVEQTKDPSLRAVIVKWAKELHASPQWNFEKCPLREGPVGRSSALQHWFQVDVIQGPNSTS